MGYGVIPVFGFVPLPDFPSFSVNDLYVRTLLIRWMLRDPTG